MRQHKITCVRCEKFWFEVEPRDEALCPLCEAVASAIAEADAAIEETTAEISTVKSETDPKIDP